MKNNLKKILIGTISIMIIFPIIWFGMRFYWQDKTKNLYTEYANNEEAFAYTTFQGTLNQALYSDDLEGGKRLAIYYNNLSNYYNKLQNGEIQLNKEYSSYFEDTVYTVPYVLPVPIKYIGVEESFYIEEIKGNNLVVKGIVFNTFCWGYHEFYMAKSTVHNVKPPEVILKKFYDFLETIPKMKSYEGRPSPFGFYCN